MKYDHHYYKHTHTHTHTRARARTHTHAHTKLLINSTYDVLYLHNSSLVQNFANFLLCWNFFFLNQFWGHRINLLLKSPVKIFVLCIPLRVIKFPCRLPADSTFISKLFFIVLLREDLELFWIFCKLCFLFLLDKF